MKNKIFFSIFIFITLFLAISTISASECTNDGDIGVLDDNSHSIISESDMEDSSQSVVSKNDWDDNSLSLGTENEKDYFSGSLLADGGDGDNESETDNSDDSESSSSGSNSTVSSKKHTYIKVIDKNLTYHVGSVKEIYQLRLKDSKNNPISGKKLTLKVCGKTYTAKTNSKGIAAFYLSHLKKGDMLVKFSFSKSGNYLASSGSAKIKVKAKLTKDNGYWATYDIFRVNYKKLSKSGVRHLFIPTSSFSIYGKKKVLKWIRKVHKYDIKVHVWLSAFYNFEKNSFIHPAYKNGKFNKKRMNFLFKKVKYYAGLKEIDGIHFDYLRYPYGAYKYKNGVKAVNYFVKKATKIISEKNPRIIISAAVRSDPKNIKRHYAQDVPTLSKYLDVMVPMVYKGNYHKNSKWVKKITKQFVKVSKGAQIWTGLLSYKSDRNPKILSYKALRKDAVSAKKGGASGIILFRLGYSKNLNFKGI